MIEGDNLEVLKLLQKIYAGKVKLIYIDPPYNTGKDFVYPDDFQDNIKNYLELTGQVDQRRTARSASNTEASRTLPYRLAQHDVSAAQAREEPTAGRRGHLLSIDDHEVANLRRSATRMFGEENFLRKLIWQEARAWG